LNERPISLKINVKLDSFKGIQKSPAGKQRRKSKPKPNDETSTVKYEEKGGVVIKGLELTGNNNVTIKHIEASGDSYIFDFSNKNY
jgi:hypothetical protein